MGRTWKEHGKEMEGKLKTNGKEMQGEWKGNKKII